MAISYMNTDEVQNIVKDINYLTDELNREFNSLFLRFSEVPTVTKEWIGGQSEFYFNAVAKDKKKYLNFVKALKSVSKNLNNAVENMQDTINKNIKQEKDKE